MNLYEVTNGKTGESYVRCYVWASNEEWAINEVIEREDFDEDISKLKIKHLFSSDSDIFVTEWSDSGFELESTSN